MHIKRIVIIGPESTGKSTLSEALAKAYNTAWVPEYARQYLEHLDRPYEERDLLNMARGQMRLEDAFAEHANNYLFCDTCLRVIKVWSEHKYQRCAPWVLQTIAERKYDLFLLTGIDMPWDADPLREHGDPHMRQYFYEIYEELLVESGIPWIAVNGNEQKRLATAMAAIKHLL